MRNLTLFVVLATFGVGLIAAAEISDNFVCGKQIENSGPLAWGNVKEKEAKESYEIGDLAGVYRVIWQLVKETSIDWSEGVRKPVLRQFKLLLYPGSAPSDFIISTDPAALDGKQYLFFGTENSLELPKNPSNPLCKEDELHSRVEAAYFAKLVRDATGDTTGLVIPEVVKRIGGLEAAYDKYLFEGFPMFPWEALVNSWLLTKRRIADGPPRNQIVFLHPAAGVIGSDATKSDAEIVPVLSIEPLGVVRYTANFEHHYGFSLLTTFPTDRDPGIGFALNYDSFKLGITWHKDEDGPHDGAAVFFGVDLYGFVGDKIKRYNGFKEKAKQLSN